MLQDIQTANIFAAKYDAARKIVFNQDWISGSIYFDGAVHGAHAPFLVPGKIVASLAPDGRRLILLGTPFGNIVVFDHNVPDGKTPVISQCSSSYLHRATGVQLNAPLRVADVDFIFGGGGFPDVGTALKNGIDFDVSDPNTDRIKEMFAKYKDVQTQAVFDKYRPTAVTVIAEL